MSRITLLYIGKGFSFEVRYMENIQGSRQKLDISAEGFEAPLSTTDIKFTFLVRKNVRYLILKQGLAQNWALHAVAVKTE